jgi:hypothetical protein
MPNRRRHPNRHLRPSGTTKPTSTDEYRCWWAYVGLTGFEPATLCSQMGASPTRATTRRVVVAIPLPPFHWKAFLQVTAAYVCH